MKFEQFVLFTKFEWVPIIYYSSYRRVCTVQLPKGNCRMRFYLTPKESLCNASSKKESLLNAQKLVDAKTIRCKSYKQAYWVNLLYLFLHVITKITPRYYRRSVRGNVVSSASMFSYRDRGNLRSVEWLPVLAKSRRNVSSYRSEHLSFLRVLIKVWKYWK